MSLGCGRSHPAYPCFQGIALNALQQLLSFLFPVTREGDAGVGLKIGGREETEDDRSLYVAYAEWIQGFSCP